jgi:hypothetical protein
MSRRVILLAAALLLAAAPALCQDQESRMGLPPGHPPLGQGRGAQDPAPGPLHWNPQTVQDFEGTITAMGPALPPQPGQKVKPAGALMIDLDTPQGTQQVVLGPGWYLDQQEPKLKLGDQVKVRGSVVTEEGRRYVLAQRVTKDGQTLSLRDDSGFPVWSGRGAGGGCPPPPAR